MSKRPLQIRARLAIIAVSGISVFLAACVIWDIS